MKKAFIYLIVPTILLVSYIAWPSIEITHPSGIIVKEEPYQQKPKRDTTWIVDEYQFRSLADFRIQARVLSKESYSLDRESDISPYDLALGWGPMSDQAIIDQMDIWQRNRWYYWETSRYPIPRTEIQKNSANMHIIPADDEVETQLDNIVKGNIIEIEGYLVFVNSTVDQWRWKSSLSRKDTGGGACEVVWADKITILR
jgi:hypothetical protein